MNQSNAINATMHARVAIIKAIGNQASREEIITLVQACVKELGVEPTGDIQADTNTIVAMTGDGAFRRVMSSYFNRR